MTGKKLRIVLADDHPIFLIGLRAVLGQDPDVQIVGEASSPDELARVLQACPCDILVTDFMMPVEQQVDGLRLMKQIRRHHPALSVLVVTMLNNTALFRSILALGVVGLLSKASLAAELPTAIANIRQNKPYIAATIRHALALAGEVGPDRLMPHEQLSPKEFEVLRMLAAGNTVGAVATQLNRSKQTVSAQKINAMRKLGLTNEAALFLYFQEHGLG